MPAISQILAPTIILNEQGPTANATMPTIPAGSNRFIPVTFAMYNGGGTSSPPTTVSCNSINAVKIVGDSTAQTRTTTSTWFFKESDAAAISGGTLISSGGTGSQKSITVEVLENCAQTTPTNFANGYTGTSQVLTMALTRAANSWTIAKGFTSTSATQLSFPGSPSRSGSSNFTARWMSYAGVADTAQTANFVCNGSNFTSAHVFNIEPFPTGTITDLNSGGNVKAGSTGNSVTSSGFSPTGGTGGGKTLTAWSGSNPYTFTQPAYVDGGTYPEPDTLQTFTFTDGSQSPQITRVIESPINMTSVVAASPIIDEESYFGYALVLQGITPVTNDRFVYPTESGNFSIAADGKIRATTAGTRVLYLWSTATGIITLVNLPVTEEMISGAGNLTSTGLTSSGLTSSGLTSH